MKRYKVTLTQTILSLLILLAAPIVSADEDTPPGTMVFLPFSIQTQTLQPHLQKGLTNVLATRMSKRTGLIAIQRGKTAAKLSTLLEEGDQESFRKMLNEMKGDYLFLGSLEEGKDQFELMIYVFSRKGVGAASFARTISSLDMAIPSLNEMSGEIAEKVFKQTQPEQKTALVNKQDGTSGFQTAHPDRAYREGLYGAATILDLDEGSFKIQTTRRSQRISRLVKAMDIGDIDGDGKDEIVLLAHGRLILYHFSSDHFQEQADYPLPNHLNLHNIYLADIDGDHKMEIYISASNGDNPASQVYSWDGSILLPRQTNIPFYLRPGLNRSGNPRLLGQIGGLEGVVGSSFFEMIISTGGKLEKGEKISIPKGFNLSDFIFLDLDSDGTQEFIGLTRKNYLQVMSQDGTLLWESDAGYGASKDFLGTLSSNRTGSINYLHTRLIGRDMDGDGSPEILIGRNRLTTVKFLKRLRYFEGSSIAALKWDGSQMLTLWETHKIPGYTTDYQVVPGDGSGDDLNLYFLESDSSYPLFFWESNSSAINRFTMGRKQTSSEK